MDTGAGTRRWLGVLRWKVQYGSFQPQCAVGWQKPGRAVDPQWASCPANLPRCCGKVRAGSCLGMGYEHSSAPLNVKKRGLTTIC